MNVCLADLHVHTALSPCAAAEMTPPTIVERAIAEGLHMIAVCDHNSARNTEAVQQAAGERLAVLAGIEITSAEECHVVGLFPDAEAAGAAGAEIDASLPPAPDGYALFFGEQHVLAADGAPTGEETAALATASALSLDATVALVHRHGGLAVAAHIDRTSFGVIGQLGFFPAEAGFDAVELSRHVAPGSIREADFRSHRLPVLHSSDSHYPDEIGSVHTVLHIQRPTFGELVLAMRTEGGRSIDDA